MGNIKAIIFDLDGTLVNLPINWDEIREKVRRVLKTRHPLKPLGVSVYEIAKNNPPLLRRAFAIIESEELEAAQQAKYNSEIHNLILYLKSIGLKIGLVTMQGRKSATIVLDKLKVKELFDVIVTREDHVYRLEQLKIALRKLDIRPKEAIFVGDTVWDKEAGTRLGCITLIIKNNISNVLDVKHKIRELLGDPC